MGEAVQVGERVLVELERAGQVTALFRMQGILGADAGELGDLLPSQAGYAASPSCGQPDLLGADLGGRRRVRRGRRPACGIGWLAERQGERLPQWLDAVRQVDLPSLHTLAVGIDRDGEAVIAGLTLPWNSGVVEGRVNQIKMLKRQMFGRAGFALLRKRALLAP